MNKKKRAEKLQKEAQKRKTADARADAWLERGLKQSRGLQSAGLPMEKSWLTCGDDTVCEICNGNAEAGWIPLDEPFPSGHMRPLAHDGCRCDLLIQMAMPDTDPEYYPVDDPKSKPQKRKSGLLSRLLGKR